MIATILITESPDKEIANIGSVPLTIEVARTIVARATTGFHSPTTLTVLGLDEASEEVQNTFLKILEEHPDSVSFLFPVRSDTAILPTIRSRCRIVRKQSAHIQKQIQYPWDTFLPQIKTKKILPSVALKITNAKKEVYVEALTDFLLYCRMQTMQGRTCNLTAALSALRLIVENNADPELAFNTAFL